MTISDLLIIFCVWAINRNVWAENSIEFGKNNHWINEDDGFYWRDYYGDIPKDAFPGGKTASGGITYIGQVLHDTQLIPAKIEINPKRVTYEWGYQEFIATDNIKILCTRNPENFQWLTTKFDTFKEDVADKNPVRGGYEEDAKLLYIGRKLIDEALVTGKIISTKLQTTLNTTKNGKGIQHAEFDVLLYNPRNVIDINIRSGIPS